MTELKDEWCCDTLYLTKISVSPSNPRYCCLDEKFIIGKSFNKKLIVIKIYLLFI